MGVRFQRSKGSLTCYKLLKGADGCVFYRGQPRECAKVCRYIRKVFCLLLWISPGAESEAGRCSVRPACQRSVISIQEAGLGSLYPPTLYTALILCSDEVFMRGISRRNVSLFLNFKICINLMIWWKFPLHSDGNALCSIETCFFDPSIYIFSRTPVLITGKS